MHLIQPRTRRFPTPAAPEPRATGLREGRPYPLGATWDGEGTNFAVFSGLAESVDLCLFDDSGERRIRLPGRTDECWHGYVGGIGPGQAYGFRVNGPWNPAQGQRCNPAKLLLDPYARRIAGDLRHDPAILPYEPDSNGEARNDADSAAFVPRSIVVDPSFEWDEDRRLARPLADAVIYELHVKGFSARNPELPEQLRGTYAGLGHPASIDYLRDLGITAVELLPIHHFVSEGVVLDRGLVNYWGYNTIGFFAPHAAYAASDDPVREFKAMVQALHGAGLQVILDVVYNHTAEGNHLGPLLSFKGFDSPAYYRTSPEDAHYYADYTGTGNSLHAVHPRAVQLVLDSLRYWVDEMHVDGFRFDLASVLGRGTSLAFDTWAPLLSAIGQDPVLQDTVLIAEPWDVADGGYQLGHFPIRWSEWNDRFRDEVRDFWRSQPGMAGAIATRFSGSADIFQPRHRPPVASVNFVAVHDGFTLRDLVSYNDKHNEANGEENRDGTSNNRSWNLGAEGETDDPAILARRARQVRNLLATTILAHGVPLIMAGDEAGRTQQGNNNAYCQDNEISWFDWTAVDDSLVAFVRHAIALRRRHQAFRRRTWARGRDDRRSVAELAWFTMDDVEMRPEYWNEAERRALAFFVDDQQTRPAPPRRRSRAADRFYVMLNAGLDPVTFQLPSVRWGKEWRPVLDTATPDGSPAGGPLRYLPRMRLERPDLSLLVLRCAISEAGA